MGKAGLSSNSGKARARGINIKTGGISKCKASIVKISNLSIITQFFKPIGTKTGAETDNPDDNHMVRSNEIEKRGKLILDISDTVEIRNFRPPLVYK